MSRAVIAKMALCALMMSSPLTYAENIIRVSAPITMKNTPEPEFDLVDVVGFFDKHSITSSRGLVPASYKYSETGNVVTATFTSVLPIDFNSVDAFDESGSRAILLTEIKGQSCTGALKSYDCSITIEVDASQSGAGCSTLAQCSAAGMYIVYSFRGKGKIFY
ncbi:hypothetical protein [Pseudomonas sp. Leaf58]|uniref:hypothetical protein n=1 Tax=Pseudomonas sp. Leaf58 TaxID=1736226 RepID=UPI0012E90AE4|nr:hypothetical protein [Pseudomonas sp. Leaf58]